MTYDIEVHARWVSYHSESGQWLDGDSRLIRELPNETHTFDPDDTVDAVTWASQYLRASESWEPSVWPVPSTVGEHTWLSACYEDPHTDEHLESTAYLTGDWTDEQRAEVFRRATANTYTAYTGE